MRIVNAKREEMKVLSDVHAGAGKILFNSLWDRADFETPFAFVHCAILLPGGGIGYHRCRQRFTVYPQRADGDRRGRCHGTSTLGRGARHIQPH